MTLTKLHFEAPDSARPRSADSTRIIIPDHKKPSPYYNRFGTRSGKYRFSSQFTHYDGTTAYFTVRMGIHTHLPLPSVITSVIAGWSDNISLFMKADRFQVSVHYSIGPESLRDTVIPTAGDINDDWVQQLINAQEHRFMKNGENTDRSVYFTCRGSYKHINNLVIEVENGT